MSAAPLPPYLFSIIYLAVFFTKTTVLTTGWMPSEIMADEPVTAATMNLISAMIRLPARAATTAIQEPLENVKRSGRWQ